MHPGDPPQTEAMKAAVKAASSADLLIVLGCSFGFVPVLPISEACDGTVVIVGIMTWVDCA